MIILLFYVALFVLIFFVANAIAEELREARPLPRVKQLPPRLVATPSWVYGDVLRERHRARRARQAMSSNSEGGRLVRLSCEGHCAGSTTHEDDGDGTATCRRCGTPRSSTPDGA
ncbi:hypothetical protein [Streptomyces sp. NPDC050988]|uniref:hypothetical protein n=1 Tax=Streptomyces sp. NPDC050988 TaxID=3365637 RepID=UPI0037957A36